MPEKPRIDQYARQLLICVGPYCEADGMTPDAVRHLGSLLTEAGVLEDGPQRVKPTRVHCLGACSGGPIMCVQPDGVWYCALTPPNLALVVNEHLVGGKAVEEFVFHRGPGSIGCT